MNDAAKALSRIHDLIIRMREDARKATLERTGRRAHPFESATDVLDSLQRRIEAEMMLASRSADAGRSDGIGRSGAT